MKTMKLEYRAATGMLRLLFMAAGMLSQSGCFITGGFGGPIGKGKHDNTFTGTPGIELGYQHKDSESGMLLRYGAGYRPAKNEVGTAPVSSTTGHIITPLFCEGILLRDIPNSAFDYFFSSSLQWSMITLDDADGYNHYGTWYLGGGVKRTYGKADWWFGARLGYVFGFDLEQNVAFELTLSVAPAVN